MFLPNSFTLTSLVHEAMRMVAKANQEQPDRFADAVLRKWLMDNHAHVLDYLRERELNEVKFEESIKVRVGEKQAKTNHQQ